MQGAGEPGLFRDLARRIDVLFSSGDLEAPGRDLRLDVAQRDRQQRTPARLQDPEIGGELRERRVLVGVKREGEPVGVGELATRVVLDSRRDLDGEGGALGKRPLERDLVDVLVPLVRPGDLGRPLPPVRAFHGHLARLGGRDRPREEEPNRCDRDAGGSRVLAPATEGGDKRRSDGELERLVGVGGDAGCGRDSLPPDQAHLGAGREVLAGLDEDDRRGRTIPIAVTILRLEDLLALASGNDPNAHAAGDPGHGEADIAQDRFFGRFSVQQQDEDLGFVDAGVPFVRQRKDDRRAAGGEREAALARDLGACQRAQTRRDAKLAANSCREVALEVVDPVPAVGPAPGPLLGAVDLEGRHGLARVADRNHRFGEARAHLTHAPGGPLRGEELDPGRLLRDRRRAAEHPGRKQPGYRSSGLHGISVGLGHGVETSVLRDAWMLKLLKLQASKTVGLSCYTLCEDDQCRRETETGGLKKPSPF